MRTYKNMLTLAFSTAALTFGCGHYLVPGKFQPLEADQQVAAIAVAGAFRAWACTLARRRLEHRRGLPVGCLVAPNFGRPRPRSGSGAQVVSLTYPHRRYEEPFIGRPMNLARHRR